MILVNEQLKDAFRAARVCELCGKPARGKLDACHVFSRGAGQVDVRSNLLAGHRLCHSMQGHGNGVPPARMLEIAAKREGTTPDAIRDVVYAVRRYQGRKRFEVGVDGAACDRCWLPEFLCECR